MNAIQIILITLLAALKKVDQKGPQIFIYNTVFWGFLAGAIMGDIMTGMAIGATFQLMSLGVAAIGGTSVPDYQIGAIISIAIAVSTGQGIEAGIAVGLPVAMLAVQLDVLGNIAHGIFVQGSDICDGKEMEFLQYDVYYLYHHNRINDWITYLSCCSIW